VVAGPRPLGRTLTARTDEQALIAAEDKGGGSRPPQGLSRPDPPVQAWPFPGRHRSQPCSPNGHAGAAELLRPLARLRQWQDQSQWQDQIQGPQRGRRTRGTPPANLVGSRKDRVGQPVQPTTPLFFCPLRCYAPPLATPGPAPPKSLQASCRSEVPAARAVVEGPSAAKSRGTGVSTRGYHVASRRC